MERPIRSPLGLAVTAAIAGLLVACSGAPPSTAPTPGVFSVRLVYPNVGPTDEGTEVQIAGAEFKPGAIVTVGGIKAQPISLSSKSFGLYTPAHAAGAADLTITNPDGRSDTLTGGYTYMTPESFDFNGTWNAYAYPKAASEDFTFRFTFTIQNNAISNVSCSAALVPLPATPLTTNRAFAASGAGVSIAGQMSDVGFATGTLHAPACGASEYWEAFELTRIHW